MFIRSRVQSEWRVEGESLSLRGFQRNKLKLNKLR